MSAFELCSSIGNKFFKKKVSREIVLDLISLFHIQIQEPPELPPEHLPFLQNFQIIAKYLLKKYFKQEVDDDLSVCIYERSSCGLSLTGDIKIYQCPMIKK